MQKFIHTVTSDLHFFDTYVVSLHLCVLIGFLLAATVVDVRERRIPNLLVATGTVIGIIFHAIGAQGAGISFALSGAGIGLLMLFPLYALGVMGAGDAKLMGMIGAFLGMTSVLGAVLATLAAGGILALGMAAYKRLLPQLLVNLHLMLVQRHIKKMGGAVAIAAPPSVGKMPYAVAICAGTLIQLFFLS